MPFEPCLVPRSPLLAAHANSSFSRWRACYGAALGDPDTRAAEARCEPGSFCVRGLRFECPPGFAGPRAGETRVACGGRCPRGFHCPWGSANATARPCGSPALYCPPGSGAPTPVDLGHYSDPLEPPALRSRQLICEPGHYCVNGTRFACPAGRFGAQFGLFGEQCSGECAPGFFCPAGSRLPSQVQCGLHRAAAVFCPGGSARPLSVAAGFYSLGGFEGVIGLAENTTRSLQARCEPGHYCVGGVRYQCPEGTFGADFGLASPACSGPSAPGHFAPPGSVSATEFRCGELFLFLVDVLLGVEAQAAIQANQYNSSDRVPITDPAFDFEALYGLYAQLQRGSTVPSGLDGAAEGGAWRELADYDARLLIFDPSGSGDAAGPPQPPPLSPGANASSAVSNATAALLADAARGARLWYNASSGLLQLRRDLSTEQWRDRYAFPDSAQGWLLAAGGRSRAEGNYFFDVRAGASRARNGTIEKPLACGPQNFSAASNSSLNCSVAALGAGEAEAMLLPAQVDPRRTDVAATLRGAMDGSVVLQLSRVGPQNFTTVAVARIAQLRAAIAAADALHNATLTAMLARGESALVLGNEQARADALMAALNASLAANLRDLSEWDSWGATGKGSNVLGAGVRYVQNATVLNWTATIPWRAGVRFRLPPVFVPIESFAATMRHLVQGGPASVCESWAHARAHERVRGVPLPRRPFRTSPPLTASLARLLSPQTAPPAPAGRAPCPRAGTRRRRLRPRRLPRPRRRRPPPRASHLTRARTAPTRRATGLPRRSPASSPSPGSASRARPAASARAGASPPSSVRASARRASRARSTRRARSRAPTAPTPRAARTTAFRARRRARPCRRRIRS